MRTCILVVDDEPAMTELVGVALEAQGLDWVAAHDAASAVDVALNQRIDLIVADIMMPGESGLDLCRRVKAVSTMPVVLVSALGTTDERIAGLEAGADDYIAKPFSPRELVLRVQAVLRRERARTPDSGAALRTVGDLGLDASALAVTVRGGRVHVSAGEFRMLWLLAERPGETVHWRDLFEAMGEGTPSFGGRGAVRTAVYRLRGKLEDSPDSPRRLLTDHGRGYRLVAGE